MASVYVARAQGVAGFERLVAIKVLHPHLAYEQEFISMFLDEARLAARIRHMNVVPTLDMSDSPGDGYFLVMEYIEGDHLGSLLGQAAKQGERLPRPFVCRAVLDTLQGLAAAHRLTDENGKPLKLVHRDVSPHNILVGTDAPAMYDNTFGTDQGSGFHDLGQDLSRRDSHPVVRRCEVDEVGSMDVEVDRRVPQHFGIRSWNRLLP